MIFHISSKILAREVKYSFISKSQISFKMNNFVFAIVCFFFSCIYSSILFLNRNRFAFCIFILFFISLERKREQERLYGFSSVFALFMFFSDRCVSLLFVKFFFCFLSLFMFIYLYFLPNGLSISLIWHQ